MGAALPKLVNYIGAILHVWSGEVNDDRIQEATGFGDSEAKILEFERFWWKYAGAKERAIKENLGMSATRYYQLLNQIIDMPEAVAYDPILVKRLQRLRSFRQRERVARRAGAQAPSTS